MRSEAGYSIVSILSALLLTSILMAGAFRMLSTQTKAYSQQDLAMAMEQNLRVSLDQLDDALRSAGAAAPTSDLAAWVPWVPGFDDNPHITTSPTLLSVARCTGLPVAVLASPAASGATTLMVDSDVAGKALGDLLDVGARRLVAIDDVEHAHVTAVGTSSIEIDTDPTTAGAQGLARGYPTGTPLCRVDVTTYGILRSLSGKSQLFRDSNQGNGPEPFADSITDLQVTPLIAGRRYEIRLTGRSDHVDPLSEAPLQRTLKAVVSVRNAG